MTYAYIEVQLISTVITLLLLICNRFSRKQFAKIDRTMEIMLWINFAKTMCYIATLLLEGKAGLAWLDSILTCGKTSLGFPMIFFYAFYIRYSMKDSKKFPRLLGTANMAVCASGIAMNVVSIFTPLVFSCAGGIYRRGPLFLCNQLLAFIVLILNVSIIIKCRKNMEQRDMISLLLYAVAPIISSVAQIFLPPEPDLSDIGITIGLLVVFIISHIERESILAEKERELTELRVSLLMSQIKPHFLYNTLAVIQEMCHGKAPDAEETTIQFSEYLRGNMDALGQTKLVRFDQELNHTMLYLSLEKKRFGNMLQIKYDIRVEDFMLPVLTLQPIVENAVKHGVMKKENGGTVTISTKMTDKNYEVIVKDNGVGFCPGDILNERGSHIGMRNVRDRLKDMCGGTFDVVSVPGSGTTVTIRIPKGENRN